jgi:subtilisin family serine protease
MKYLPRDRSLDMRKRASALLAVVFLLSAGVAVPATADPVSSGTHRVEVQAARSSPIPDQYLVTLDPGTDPWDVLRRVGITPLFVYHEVILGFAARLSSLQLAVLQALPSVDTIEQDSTISIDDPGDSEPVAMPRAIPLPWGLDRIDQRTLPLDGSYTPQYDGSGVTAYIVDTGIHFPHPEFGGRAVPGFDGVGDGLNGGDCHGHGTHVAATVGGAKFGVAKNVRLVSVRTHSCTNVGMISTVIAGLDWIGTNIVHPAVVNFSLYSPTSLTLNVAADNLVSRGVFIAEIAGNAAQDACGYSLPSAAGPLTVGATGSYPDPSVAPDAFASYSNYGTCVDILAPGTDILSASNDGQAAYRSGTSQAAPHVTGVVALLKQAYGDQTPSGIYLWLVQESTQGAVTGLPLLTPDRLLYSPL